MPRRLVLSYLGLCDRRMVLMSLDTPLSWAPDLEKAIESPTLDGAANDFPGECDRHNRSGPITVCVYSPMTYPL
ncbi:MAG UNVERIFIED_CONTAM: hypothetical protein LVR29_16785 [Microcystis novacekii LVE1205-3]